MSLPHCWSSRRAAYPDASGPADPCTVAEPKARKVDPKVKGPWGAQMCLMRFHEEPPPEKPGVRPAINWDRKTRPKSGSKNETKNGFLGGHYNKKMYRSRILSPFLGSESEPKNGFGKWSPLCPIRLRFGVGFCSRMDGFEAPSRLGFCELAVVQLMMSKVPAGNKAQMNNMDEVAIQLFLDC